MFETRFILKLGNNITCLPKPYHKEQNFKMLYVFDEFTFKPSNC